MGASRPAAVRPKWSSTTARMPLSTQRSVSSALILCSFSSTVSGLDSSAGSAAASFAGAAGVSAADASPGAAFAAASAGWAASAGAASGAETGASGSSSRPTNGMLMLSSMLGGASRVGAAGAASSSPSPKKRNGWVGSARASSGSGLRVRSSAKTIFGRAAQAFSSASNAAVSTPSTSCGAGVSASGRAGFGAGKSRALSSCISACSFCSCGVSGPRT